MIRWIPLYVALSSAVGCAVWRDYGEAPQPDVGTSPDGGCASCPDETPWWDDAYAFRAPLLGELPGEPMVLPIVISSDTVDGARRADVEDVRVVSAGGELPRSISLADAGLVVLWVRFSGMEQTAHLYWGNADAPVASSPWDGYAGAFHFEDDTENAVPGGERIENIGPLSDVSGRIGRGVGLEGGGSVRMFAPVLSQGATTFAFSFQGRWTENSDRALMQVPRQPCRIVELSRTADRRTKLGWVDPQTCDGNGDPVSEAIVDVDLTDGAWHDVVATVSPAAGRLTLTVDSEQATQSIRGPPPPDTDRTDLRGAPNLGTEVFAYDELIVANLGISDAGAALWVLAIRGELFEIGTVESRP